jgi:hypothetical protein
MIDFDDESSIASDASCITSFVNKRRVASYTCSDGPEQPRNKQNLVKTLRKCNASIFERRPLAEKFHSSHSVVGTTREYSYSTERHTCKSVIHNSVYCKP